MERQKAREENEELKDKLDEEYAAIAGGLVLRDKEQEREQARLERAAQRKTNIPAAVAAAAAAAMPSKSATSAFAKGTSKNIYCGGFCL